MLFDWKLWRLGVSIGLGGGPDGVGGRCRLAMSRGGCRRRSLLLASVGLESCCRFDHLLWVSQVLRRGVERSELWGR